MSWWRSAAREEPQAAFTLEKRGSARILRILPHDGLIGTDAGEMDRLFKVLRLSYYSGFNVLLILVPPDALAPENAETLWRAIATSGEGRTVTRDAEHGHDQECCREGNAMRRFISTVLDADTFVVCVLQGNVLFPFLGCALACDYRVVADDTVFVNRCLESGLPPAGGLPWFLARLVGHGQAAQILLERESLTAEESLELGLVNRVVPRDDLEDHALAFVDQLAERSPSGLWAAKRMLAAAHCDLQAHLEQENQVLDVCLKRRWDSRLPDMPSLR